MDTHDNLTPVMSIADNLTTEEVETWINCDMDAPPFHILSEEEIVTMANNFDEPESDISSEQSEEDDSVVPRISIQDAINASTTLLKFLESGRCSVITEQDTIQIYRIQEKLMSENIKAKNKKQTTLHDFF